MREICVGSLDCEVFHIARPRVGRVLVGQKERGYTFEWGQRDRP